MSQITGPVDVRAPYAEYREFHRGSEALDQLLTHTRGIMFTLKLEWPDCGCSTSDTDAARWPRRGNPGV